MASDYSKEYGLHSNWYGKRKSWAVDQDYIDQLSPADRAWLDRFNREYHGGDIKKGDPKAIHFEDELRKDCYRRNNKQNRDLLSRLDARGMMTFQGEDFDPLDRENEAFFRRIERSFRPKSCKVTKRAIEYARAYLLVLELIPASCYIERKGVKMAKWNQNSTTTKLSV